LGEVTRDVWLQQGQQLDVGAVLIPPGERAVLRSLTRCEPVDLQVAAEVAAVDVVEDVRLQHRVVERGVEGRPLRVGATGDADVLQLAPPVPIAVCREPIDG
jgi:hypothetical protein